MKPESLNLSLQTNQLNVYLRVQPLKNLKKFRLIIRKHVNCGIILPVQTDEAVPGGEREM